MHINIGPKITINIFLPNRVFGRGQISNKCLEVAHRFIALFEEHGISLTQIPRLMPQLTMSNLKSMEDLSIVLNDKLLDQTADLFRVRRSWLEGSDQQIYETEFCYNNPHEFFRIFNGIERPRRRFEVRIISSEKFGTPDAWHAPLALILLERVTEWDDTEVYRYIIFGDRWIWGERQCRIQLKALARISHLRNTRVPIHTAPRESIDLLLHGKAIPHRYLKGPVLSEPSLEDFALSEKESAVAKDAKELPVVLEYIIDQNLQKYLEDTTTTDHLEKLVT